MAHSPKHHDLIPQTPGSDAALIDWALWHQAHGAALGAYAVTPNRPGEKRPYLPKWNERLLKTRAEVQAHWRTNPNDNVGLCPLPGHFWLDVDNVDALEAAERHHGRIPATYAQRTLNGGYHFLLKGDAAGSPSFEIDGQKLGEIRGALSGQCVGAGSRGTRKDGEPGSWQIEELKLPADAPAWIIAAVKSGAHKPAANDARGDYGEVMNYDTAQAVALVEAVEAGELIKDYEGPFIEGERDNGIFKLFAEGKGRMIHPHALLEAIERSGIAGGFDAVERKMQSAYFDGNTQAVYGAKVLAYYAPNYLHKPRVNGKEIDRAPADPVAWKADNSALLRKLEFRRVHDPAPKPANDRGERQFYYLDELDSVPDPSYVIDGILVEGGATLVYGRRATKKSFGVLDMLLSIAAGAKYHGREVKAGRVVILAGEGASGLKKRIAAWFKARGIKRDAYARNIAVVRLQHKLDTAPGRGYVRQILRQIAEDGPISYVVVDTVRKAMSGDENAPTAVGQFLDGISELCREFGCGHILVHHAGKDDSKGARGGGPFEDDADTVLRFTKGADGLVHMTCTKQKDDEADWTMKFSANEIELGTDDSGKAVTSLTLTLAGEAMASSETAQRDKHADADALALRLLTEMQEPFIRRGDLAVRVIAALAPEIRDSDPNTFEKLQRAYAMHLTRVSPHDALWLCIGDKNEKGQALTFRNPTMNGRRAPKIGRRPNLSEGAAMT